jgi:protein-L-isoaspartate(D-aspartate) O-methyltransferase
MISIKKLTNAMERWAAREEAEKPLTERRAQMVDKQLIRRGISDKRVLEAMRSVPRHKFIIDSMAGQAYSDKPLPIGKDQTISQPYMVALMTQCLELRGHERVLEVGTGSGYQAAILAELCRKVYSIERIEDLAGIARHNIRSLELPNIEIHVGDGTLGLDHESPFDAIIVTAAAPNIPSELVQQLNDPGHLVVPIGSRALQDLTIIEKKDGNISTTRVCGCVFVPLIGQNGWAEGVK